MKKDARKHPLIFAPRKRGGYQPKVRLEAGALLIAKYLIRPRCQAAHPKHLQNASH